MNDVHENFKTTKTLTTCVFFTIISRKPLVSSLLSSPQVQNWGEIAIKYKPCNDVHFRNLQQCHKLSGENATFGDEARVEDSAC